MAAAAAVLRMKLLIDTRSQRVVFAEAGKDVVDFLFSLLALPLATAVALVGDDRSVAGSVGRLYASVQGLDPPYLLPGADRDDLLRPTVVGSLAATASSSLSLLLPPPPPSKTFACHGCGCGGGYYGGARRFVTDARGAACPNCYQPMTCALQYISPSAAAAAGSSSGGSSSSPVQSALHHAVAGGPPSTAKGFVQGAVTYTVKDDLTVTPMSTISSITLLRAFAATDLAALQEKTVYIGNREGLQILKASLQSKTVLTDVFLGNKGWSSSSASA